MPVSEQAGWPFPSNDAPSRVLEHDGGSSIVPSEWRGSGRGDVIARPQTLPIG